MSTISKRLEQTLRRAIAKNPILPVKTDAGILVGDVLIVNEGTIKNLWRLDVLLYREVNLNIVAISLANMLAKHQSVVTADTLYKADQEYGKWFVDSQLLRNQFERSKLNQDYDRADMLWARYCESRSRTETAKKLAETLATS
jgi:hypothetical protein